MPEVAVEQVDRDAAAKALGYKDWADANDYRTSGSQDRTRDHFVLAFAKHRLAALTSLAPDTRVPGGEVEAIARAIRKALVKETGGFGKEDDKKVALLCAKAALASLRLPEQVGEMHGPFPDQSPYGEIGRRGSPDAYLIDPGAGSGSDRTTRFWPQRAVLDDVHRRGGSITPLYAARQPQAVMEEREACAKIADAAAETSMVIATNNPGSERAHYALRERDAELAIARAIRSRPALSGQERGG